MHRQFTDMCVCFMCVLYFFRYFRYFRYLDKNTLVRYYISFLKIRIYKTSYIQVDYDDAQGITAVRTKCHTL